jgi:signal peptide peptidase SppA
LNFNIDSKSKAIFGDWFKHPLLIDPSYIDFMLQAVSEVEITEKGELLPNKKIQFSANADKSIHFPDAKKNDGFVQAGNAAIININGPISYRPAGGFFRWLFGGTSYAEILDSFRAAKSSDKISRIVFNIDSPGGTVAGFDDAVNEIYEGRSSKKIISYVNPYAASAAYGLASAGHEIHVMSSSGYGSIGTVMMHLDQSKFDEKLGAKWTPIFAGAKKLDGNPHFPLSDKAKKRFQEVVDKFYGQFVGAVARNRGISEEDVRQTEAEIYYGDEGKKVGLIDSVVKGFDVPDQSSSFLFIKDQNSQSAVDQQDSGHAAGGDTMGDIAGDARGDTNNQNEEKNLMEVTMTLEELKAKFPDLFKQIQQEAIEPFEAKVSALENENKELKAQNETLASKNADMGNRVRNLEEKDILRTEAEMRARADAIWSTALAQSDVPAHLHNDIRSFVGHSKFMAEGRFDEKGFTDAVNAKIKDWEDKGVRSTVILGSGIPVSGVGEAKAREEKEDNEAVDALVALATK